MTAAELESLERARVLIRKLHAACEAVTEDARFTIVLAVPVAGDPGSLSVETAGNATRLLTEKMLTRAMLQHHLARKDADEVA